MHKTPNNPKRRLIQYMQKSMLDTQQSKYCPTSYGESQVQGHCMDLHKVIFEHLFFEYTHLDIVYYYSRWQMLLQ